ncbi:hypothetical protein SAMN02744040_01734 [Tepidibacter thalassicus DSM 15285]|uniref:Uncharacterized protein n=1 Tax=Tepidibacter thalassicus DSM 15285 TaxID=1123350 RepID=A0A1M5SEF8_9FIRM|nr:hypothetical protein SAMN02744040_01734 [Tepidibacter thalassicus DSM 15285]
MGKYYKKIIEILYIEIIIFNERSKMFDWGMLEYEKKIYIGSR